MNGTQLEIVEWSPGRVALTGMTASTDAILAAVQSVCRYKIEYRSYGAITISFAARHRREVVRLLEEFA